MEYSQLPAAFSRAPALTTLHGNPLIVLTARRAAGRLVRRPGRPRELSTNIARRSVACATHESLLYDQGYSVNASRAILHVVEALRDGAPLQP